MEGKKGGTIWHYRLWSFQERDTKLERFLHLKGFHQVWYQVIVKATVFYRLKGLKFKISEGSDQN